MLENQLYAMETGDDVLPNIAHEFLRIWKYAHGRLESSAYSTLGTNVLTVLIHSALSQAELDLAKQPAGRLLVERYVTRLVDQVYPQLATYIEHILKCQIATTNLSVDPYRGTIAFVVEFSKTTASGQRRAATRVAV